MHSLILPTPSSYIIRLPPSSSSGTSVSPSLPLHVSSSRRLVTMPLLSCSRPTKKPNPLRNTYYSSSLIRCRKVPFLLAFHGSALVTYLYLLSTLRPTPFLFILPSGAALYSYLPRNTSLFSRHFAFAPPFARTHLPSYTAPDPHRYLSPTSLPLSSSLPLYFPSKRVGGAN